MATLATHHPDWPGAPQRFEVFRAPDADRWLARFVDEERNVDLLSWGTSPELALSMAQECLRAAQEVL